MITGHTQNRNDVILTRRLPGQVAAYEQNLIEKALKESGGIKTETAEVHGFSHFSLERRLKVHELTG